MIFDRWLMKNGPAKILTKYFTVYFLQLDHQQNDSFL